mgnify:FL=1
MSDIEVLMKELKDVQGAVQTKVDAGIKPLGEEIQRMGKAIEAAQAEAKELRTRQAMAISRDSRLFVRDGRFAGYDSLDLGAAKSVFSRRPSSDRLQKVLTDHAAAEKAVRQAIDAEWIQGWEDKYIKALTFSAGASARARQMAYDIVNPLANELRAEWRKTKALDSTTAAAGDELVPTLEASELWMDVNLNTNVLPTMRQRPMPSNPFDWPTQFGATNWYPTTENTQVTSTTPTTAKVTLTAQGLKTGVPFSDELNEDAIIALVPELRSSLARNAAEVIDDVLLNGDTTTTNGINSDGATISSSTAGKAHWLLGWDGLIHLPLVDNTAQEINLNAAVSAGTAYNRAMRLIGKYAAAQVLGDTVFFADVNTVIASLTMDEVELITNFGPRATISSGELARVYGIPLVVSGQMRLADVDGKVTDSGNATNTGRILCTNLSQWLVGFRRGITFEPDREPGKGQTTLYVSFRIALQERSGTRSSATHTSLIRDITGVV